MKIKPKKLLEKIDESSKYQKCDAPGCNKEGICRAPKNNLLKEYFHFCANHAAEYNKSWNYYAGMTVEEIENENLQDIYQRNPTWSFGIKGIKQGDIENINFQDPRDILDKIFGKTGLHKTKKHEFFAPNTDIGKALKFMEIESSFNLQDLKIQYKKLVKKYHPDLSKDETERKQKEEKFKQLLDAYKTLQAHLKKIS